MVSLNKIILPVDFSERCSGGCRYVEALARRFDAEISIVHVLPPPRYQFGAADVGGDLLTELLQQQRIQAQQQLDSFLVEELKPFRVRRVLLDGDPAQRIVEFAHRETADLIVMPTHGYGPFRRFLLGSVTAKVLHDADCPVMTGVHLEEAPAADALQIRKVMAAVDLGPQSERTVRWAAKLAEAYHAPLAVLHAASWAQDPPCEYFDQDWKVDMLGVAREQLNTLLQQAGVEATIHLEVGDVDKLVASVAERCQVDLVVIGRGSAAGVFGRLRANAYSIIRNSPCPVVSV